MAINLFAPIATAITGAAKAFSTLNEATKKNTTTSTKTPTFNEHADYINQVHPGGLDAYTKLQNDRYSQALQDNNVDLLNRLQADAQRVGYSLSNPNAVPQFDNQAYLDQLAALQGQLGNYQSQLGNIQMPKFDTSGMNNIQNDLSALLSSLETYQGADSMSMDESMARAYSQLNGIYNQNLDKTLDNYNKNAISRGMFGQLPVEALKAQAISNTELDKANATNQLAGNMFSQDFNMARQKDQDFYNRINQQAGLLTNLYNTEADQYQNAMNEYLNTINLANMQDQRYVDDIYRQLDLINSQYSATQDQFNNAYKTFSTNQNIQSTNKNEAYDSALNKFNMGYVDQSVSDVLGIPLGYLQNMLSSAMASGKSSGGGSGSSGGGTESKPSIDLQDLTQQARLIASSMFPDGYTQEQLNEVISSLYEFWQTGDIKVLNKIKSYIPSRSPDTNANQYDVEMFDWLQQ